MVMMIGEKRNKTGVNVTKGEQNDEKKKGQKPMKERLVNKQRSVSCYDLQKGSRTRESALKKAFVSWTKLFLA